MKPIILMISGKQGSGKTTLARGLVRYFGRRDWYVAHLKFADPLYEMHDWIWNLMASYGLEKPAAKDGNLLQLLGTEWGRKTIGQGVWVEILRNRMEQIFLATEGFTKRRLIVVDDARFPNEIDFYSSKTLARTFRLRLEAGEHVRQTRAEMWRTNVTHPSETALDSYTNWDGIIFTDQHDADDTLESVAKIIEELSV
jgi:hypothetical protein